MQPIDAINNQDLTQAEIMEALDWDEKTFKNRFERFCSLYDFSPEEFKQKGKYKFLKEWNGLFFVLMKCLPNHPLFDRRKPKMADNLEVIITHDDELLADVDEFLPREMRLRIMSHPLYLGTTAELLMIERLHKKLADWMATVAAMPVRVRTFMWYAMNSSIDQWAQKLCIAVAEVERQAEIAQGDEILSQDADTLQLGRLDLLLADYLRKQLELKNNRLPMIRNMLDEYSRDRDPKFMQAIVDALFEKQVVPLLEDMDKNREVIVKRFVRNTNELTNAWKTIDVVLDECTSLMESTEMDEEKRERLSAAISFIKRSRLDGNKFENDFMSTAEKFLQLAISNSTLD